MKMNYNKVERRMEEREIWVCGGLKI